MRSVEQALSMLVILVLPVATDPAFSLRGGCATCDGHDPNALRCQAEHNSELSKAIADVEAHFGKSLMIQFKQVGNPYKGGESGVSDDGAPFVWINEDNRWKLATLAHETLHLEQRAKGFRNYTFFFKFKARENLRQELLISRMALRDAIRHVSIYSKMRRMGLEPQAFITEATDKALDGGVVFKDPSKRHRLIRYFTSKLELDGTPTLSRIQQLYADQGWNAEARRAEDLASKLKNAGELTPEFESELLCDVLNEMFAADGLRFTISEVRSAPTKGKHVDQEATLRVEQGGAPSRR